jgi:hypothetical protein
MEYGVGAVWYTATALSSLMCWSKAPHVALGASNTLEALRDEHNRLCGRRACDPHLISHIQGSAAQHASEVDYMLASRKRSQHQVVAIGYSRKNRPLCIHTRVSEDARHVGCQLKGIAEGGSRLPMGEKITDLKPINAGVKRCYVEKSIDLGE